jgi:excisionase family DNA binding protein
MSQTVRPMAYSVQEVADLLNISHKTVRAAIARGDLRAKRVGQRKDGRGLMRITSKALEEWLEGEAS